MAYMGLRHSRFETQAHTDLNQAFWNETNAGFLPAGRVCDPRFDCESAEHNPHHYAELAIQREPGHHRERGVRDHGGLDVTSHTAPRVAL